MKAKINDLLKELIDFSRETNIAAEFVLHADLGKRFAVTLLLVWNEGKQVEFKMRKTATI